MRDRRRTASSPEQLSDVQLIGGLMDDDGCLRVFIARHHGSVRRLALAMLRNADDADEAVQDTFIAVHRSAGQFRGDSSPRTWVHSICHRCCLARLRRKHLRLVGADEAGSAPAPIRDDTSRLAIDTAVAGLAEDLRVAFTLVDVLGFSRQEAADLVGVPGNTMRARVARARVLLAMALTDEEVV